jgi:hypothetical protein
MSITAAQGRAARTGELRRLHGNEEVHHAVVKSLRFGAYRWSYRLNVRVASAGRF